MSSDLQPLPPDILALLRKEQGAAPPSDEARARVRDRVLASAGLAATTAAGVSLAVLRSSGKMMAAGKSSLLAGAVIKLALALTLGGLGATAYVAWRAHTSKPMPMASQVAPVVDPVPDHSVHRPPLDRSTAPAVIPVVDAPASPTPAPHRHVLEDASHLKEEHALLERARAALANGDTKEALAAAALHARRFPQGQLSEERECLHIRALVVAGDVGGAKRDAAAFAHRYPNSLFQASVCASP
jgi:hypothetical protein